MQFPMRKRIQKYQKLKFQFTSQKLLHWQYEQNCSQSLIFPKDRRDIARPTVNGGHLNSSQQYYQNRKFERIFAFAREFCAHVKSRAFKSFICGAV